MKLRDFINKLEKFEAEHSEKEARFCWIDLDNGQWRGDLVDIFLDENAVSICLTDSTRVEYVRKGGI